jgi:hypothetical protein
VPPLVFRYSFAVVYPDRDSNTDYQSHDIPSVPIMDFWCIEMRETSVVCLEWLVRSPLASILASNTMMN